MMNSGHTSRGGFLPLVQQAAGRFTLKYVLVFIFLASVILTMGYLYNRDFDHKYRLGVEGQISAIAELKVAELVQYRQERLGNAALIFRNDVFSSLVERFLENPHDVMVDRELQSWLSKLRTTNQYDRILLIDSRNTLRISVPESLAPMDTVISHRCSEVLQGGQVAFEDFYRSELDQRIYLSLLVPILDGMRPLGVLVMRIDPTTYLFPFLQYWPIPSKTSETLIVRRDGNDVLFLNNLRFDTSASLARRMPLSNNNAPAVRAVLGQLGVAEGIDYRGNPVIADVRTRAKLTLVSRCPHGHRRSIRADA